MADTSTTRLSYTYIEHSVRNGRLEDPDNHVVGPRTRGSGPKSRPNKQTRTPYTDADDLVLWKWVDKFDRQGMKTQGNDMYKMLEEEVCVFVTKPLLPCLTKAE